MGELCYRIEMVPDLSLNKYSSLEGSGVDGVLEKHIAFLRQWNRKGVLSGVSIHLFYYYDGIDDYGKYGVGEQGNKLEILFVVRGKDEKLSNVPELVSASTLSPYYHFVPYSMEQFLNDRNLKNCQFSTCSTLIKREVFIKSTADRMSDEETYYEVPKWEMNEDARLYNMTKLMESLDKRMLYRVDLYPVDKGGALREALKKPTVALKERQHSKTGIMGQQDYEAENVLREYEDLRKNIDSSPHFAANIFTFGYDEEDTVVVLDAAGAEALSTGNYTIGSYRGKFFPESFLNDEFEELYDRRNKISFMKSSRGHIICHENSRDYTLKYLPTLFTLEEVAPFFRFPALYDGEVIQKRKETAPKSVSEKEGLYLGTDDNGYDVFFPLKSLSKHAFIAGVPGSGKTNTMHHLTSTLWKKHGIAFLVLEPAKKEYRALANQKGMEDLYVFSPNADMSFPLHVNPFEFPRGLMLAEHIRSLGSVFEGAFPLDNPMPFLLDTAIEAVYRELGWKPDTVYTDDCKLKFPTMSMLYKRLEDELKTTTYSEEIRGNLESALKVRIGSLLRREMGDVFDVPRSTIAPEEWLTIPAVVELESMGSGPANFLTLMLCSLIREALKVNPLYEKDHARHIIFIEEAHNLIGPESEETSGAEANPKQAATAFVVKMLAEVRALKEGIVIADQLPTVMAQEVIKNTGLKIGLRITSSDDRNLLGSTMAANPLQLEEMATFHIGRSLVSYEGLMRPFTIQTHEWCGSWATKHCSPMDKTWCEGDCPYYQDGNCIPNREQREYITTSKADAELVELLKNRRAYTEICTRSFYIEVEKLTREYNKWTETADNMVLRFKKLNAEQLKIKKQREMILQKAMKLGNEPDWEEENSQLVKELQEQSDSVQECTMVLENQIKSSGLRSGVVTLITEGLLIAKKTVERKPHWKKLGINFTDIAQVAQGDVDERAAAVATIASNMPGNIVLQMQEVYLVGRTMIENSDEIREWIERSVEQFGAKRII